jgi:hypothetical protein
MKRKTSASVIKADQLEATVRNRVKVWPEKMDYKQLDDLCGLLGCELFAGLVKTWHYEDGDEAYHFYRLGSDAGQLAKDYVKKRGFIFIGDGGANYWNATKASPSVVAQWKKEKAVRLKVESEKFEAEMETWWATLAPALKEALLSANRNAPLRPRDSKGRLDWR